MLQKRTEIVGDHVVEVLRHGVPDGLRVMDPYHAYRLSLVIAVVVPSSLRDQIVGAGTVLAHLGMTSIPYTIREEGCLHPSPSASHLRFTRWTHPLPPRLTRSLRMSSHP